MAANTSIERSAAARLRLSLDDYLAKLKAGQKHCWSCRMWKDRSAFGIDRSRGDGLACRCNPCRKPAKQMALLIETPAEYERRRYAVDSDFRFRRQQRVHARKRGIEPMPVEGRNELRDRFDGCCAYCGEPAETWDHIVAVSKGGRTEPGNILPACRSCNSSKKDRDVYDFIEEAGIVVSPNLDSALALALEWGQLSI